MHSLSLVVLVCVAFGVCSGGVQRRMKRQDWNFPGAVDNGGNNNFNNQNQRDSTTTRRPTSRPPTTRQTTPSSGGVTLPQSGTVFAAPCSRCMPTQQYNPVCGTDARTYANEGILNCATMCGINVQLGRLGVCETPR